MGVLPRLVPRAGGIRKQVGELFGALFAHKEEEDDEESERAQVAEDVLILDLVKDSKPSNFFDAKPEESLATSLDRVDYTLQETLFESMNEINNAIESHECYFANEDFVQFVLEH